MGLRFKDTQCGFKAFRREAAQIIFRLQTIERWGFDPEILFIAQRLGYSIREVAVTWGHDERSRLSYLRDGLKMLEEIAMIRVNALAGRYDRGDRGDAGYECDGDAADCGCLRGSQAARERAGGIEQTEFGRVTRGVAAV